MAENKSSKPRSKHGTYSIKHGMTETAEYAIWCAAKARCFNPLNEHYGQYGGRGITMCDEWRDSFERFFQDMGPRPEGMQLDRINNNGNYEPGNVRWATREQQSENRRDNHLISFNGETLPMSAWTRRLGFNYSTLTNRINRDGWSIERALTTPLRGSK